ncbi:MAG: preprotein translocase subunit SecY, partial [Candidatus Saccharimonadales bacterium]
MNWKVIWKSLKDSDMRNRLLAVLGMLLVFRILAHIPIPLSDPATLKQVLQTIYTSSKTSSLLGFIDVLSGGALANFSIMLIGLGPYINASIIMQLLTKAIPQLDAMNNEGEYGRKRINQYTRILTLPLAIIQSVGAIYLVRQSAASIGGIDITAHTSAAQWVLMITALTGASMLLMWLGELITEQSVGNGISLVITVGIVSRLPQTIAELASSAVASSTARWHIGSRSLPLNNEAVWYGFLALAAIVLVTVAVVLLNEAARNVKVHYAKRIQGNRTYGGVSTILPVKMITAGVIPIIFAVAFLSVPSFLGQILTSNSSLAMQHFGANMVSWFQTPSPTTFAAGGFKPFIYPLTYFLLVFVFTFFYTSITFDSKEIAENLQKQGGFIEGVRSGKQTEKYLGKMVNRLTFFGAVSLGVLAILPIIAQAF